MVYSVKKQRQIKYKLNNTSAELAVDKAKGADIVQYLNDRGSLFFCKGVSRVIQEIKEYDSDTCLEIVYEFKIYENQGI